MEIKNTSIIEWEITPSEKRERLQQFISKTWWIILSFIIFSFFSFYSGFWSTKIQHGTNAALKELLFIVIAVAVGILLIYFFNKINPYQLRTFRLDNAGVQISKGKKKKSYSWNEFECFYVYTTYRGYTPNKETDLGKIFKAEEQIMGDIFYLKKKQTTFLSKLYKTFIVIYSEPNNLGDIFSFLKDKLPQKIMTATTDFGLIFYEFK
ncbi:MAG: hypothetical protein NTU58_01110 [Candidatus Nealsonbacteria bacterium]|nr:hypothetical protein [Candidatus Nealsonbacteria bacterium]